MPNQNAMLFTVFVSADNSAKLSGNPALVYLWASMPETQTLIALSIAQTEQTLVCISPITKKHSCQLQLKSTAHFAIRWFFAGKEIQRCGHGTLAAAAYIDNTTQHSVHPQDEQTLYFQPLVGDTLITSREYDIKHQRNCYTLLFSHAEFEQQTHLRQSTAANNNTPKVITILNTYYPLTPNNWATTKHPSGYTIIQLASANMVNDFTLKEKIITALGKDALIVSAPGDQYYDIAFRYFAPAYGINEDIATGSAAPILYAFWQHQFMQTHIKAQQLSSSGGEMVIATYTSANNHPHKISASGYVNTIPLPHNAH